MPIFWKQARGAVIWFFSAWIFTTWSYVKDMSGAFHEIHSASNGLGRGWHRMIMEAVQQNEPLRTCLHVYGVVMKRAICRPHTWLWFVKRTCVSPSLLHLLKGYILFKAIFATANAKCISLVSQRLNFRRSSQIRFFC